MLGNLKQKLLKTSRGLRERLDDLFRSGKSRDQLLLELEEVLILSDMGVSASEKVIQALEREDAQGRGPPGNTAGPAGGAGPRFWAAIPRT